jgi:L-ascorbate metabolism protein UlaG (beta-lactamase superfamily)
MGDRVKLAAICGLSLAAAFVPLSSNAASKDACGSYTPALVGGPLQPKSSDIAVLRWLGNANYELNYRGKVYLFDAYFDRTSRNHPIGFTVPEIKRADYVFVSHAHFDHMSDVVPVAKQTHAKIIGAPITIETAIKLGLPPEQAITVKGGESLDLGDVTADIALARHSTIQPGLTDALAALYKVDTRANTPEEDAHTKEVMARGTFAPEVIDKGTLAFGLTLRDSVKIVTIGSAGPITDGDRELAKKLGRVDIAIIAYQPHPVAEHQVADTMPLVRLFNPKLYLPAHHDAAFGTWLDLGLEPLFTVLRDEMKGTKFLAPLYRSPICIATAGAKHGQVVKFQY